jgi:nicotinate-nucleotide adenylyltransferase
MKIGLFFGSFNPIHIGHLIVANIMAEHTDLEQIWFVVSPLNPFKSSKSLIHEFDRLDMVEQAITDNYNFKTSDVEFNMPKPSYTVDTIAYLTDKNPQHEFKLIIGEDNLKYFPKWKNHEIILEQYGAEPSALRDHPNVRLVSAPLLDISATFIRKCVKEGKSIKYLVPEGVAEYIERKKLFV